MPTQIVNLILDKIVDQFRANLNVGLTATDLEYVHVIKKGLLQEDKIRRNLQVGVVGGSHEDPDYKDGIVTADEMPNIGIMWQAVAREVGGGQLWWRRGTINLDFFFIREKLVEDDAHQVAYSVLGKVLSLIEPIQLGMVDDFGERAEVLYCYENTFYLSGGIPKNFIFRGKVFWQCLTWRP